MTPSLLQRSIARYFPAKTRLAVTGVVAFLTGLLLLVVFFPWLSSNALFVAWPFFGAFMLAAGLLIVSFLYSRYERTPPGLHVSLGHRANQIALWLFAPFYTLWLAGVVVITFAGIALGLTHLYSALFNSG